MFLGFVSLIRRHKLLDLCIDEKYTIVMEENVYKPFVAKHAGKWSFLGVGFEVCFQTQLVLKLPVTNVTLKVSSFVRRMLLQVSVERTLPAIHFVTHFARKLTRC